MGGIIQIVSTAAVGFLAACAGSAAMDPDSYDLDSISQVPRDELARRLLGTERASDVENFEIETMGLMEQLRSVAFFHRPIPDGTDICSRMVEYVPFYPLIPVDPATPPRQIRMRPAERFVRMEIALASSCRLRPGQRFASLGPGIDVARGSAVLRDLAAARSAAAAGGDLRFSLVCADETQQGSCSGDGHRALAELNNEQVWAIGRAPDGEGSRAFVGNPGQLYWEITLAGFGTSAASLRMIRKVPAPF